MQRLAWLALVLLIAGGCADDGGDKDHQRLDGATSDAAGADLGTGDLEAVDAPPDRNAWAIPVGGSAALEGVSGVAVDSAGNSFITGGFSGTVRLGAHQLTSRGDSDVFVAKLDSGGRVLWAVAAGGSTPDSGSSIAVDGAGNSYVAGEYRGTAGFGGTTLSPEGVFDVFVAKLDGSGKFLWAVSLGGPDPDSVTGIAVDGAGSTRVTGLFGVGMEEASRITIGATTLLGKGDQDIYVARLDSSGKFLWAVMGGGTTVDTVKGIGLDGSGNSYIAGSISDGTAAFGATDLTTTGSPDLFVAKLDSAGGFLWAVRPSEGSSPVSASAAGITVDGAGNSHVVGSFNGEVTFGTSALTAKGALDLFVARVSTAGQFLWAGSASPAPGDPMPAYIAPGAIALDSAGNAHITGTFGTLDQKATATFGTTTLTVEQDADIFVATLDATGTFVSAVSAGAAGKDNGLALGVDGSGKRYVGGRFSGMAIFDDTTLIAAGGDDGFLWKVK